MRICGACRLCCKLFPVPVLEKPPGEWCRYVCSSGCSVHGPGQPEVCRQYACVWLDHEEVPDEFRPDRIGVVVSECGTIDVGGEELSVFMFHEDRAGACRGPEAEILTNALAALGSVVLLVEGESMDAVYDRERYPSISPRDIEAAFRYRRSEDAEELKRLGAVADDFQPLAQDEVDES